MTTLDERAMRLPNFRAGEPCLLSDGKIWTFRTPRVVVETTVGELRTVLAARWTFGDAKVDIQFVRLMESISNPKHDLVSFYENSIMEIAILELLLNYSLPRFEARMLLLPRAGYSRDDVRALVTRVTVATAIRAQEVLRAAERTLPYHTVGDYHRLDPQTN